MELGFDQLLWHTRGQYWDYEFLCLPKHVTESAFALMERIVRDYSSQRYPVHFKGTFVGQPFVGILDHDANLRDHASRAVEHLAIWFLPKGTFPEQVPASWFTQFYTKSQAVFDSDQIYRMTEDQKMVLYREKIPLGKYLREEISSKIGTMVLPIQNDVPPPHRNDMGEVVKKNMTQPRRELTGYPIVPSLLSLRLP